jgi:hypothetical protein
MINEVSNSVLHGAACHYGFIQPDNVGSRRPWDEFGYSSQRRDSPAVPVVVLVEKCDDVFDGMAKCFATAGFQVARARNSVQAIKSYAREPADLLVVNADQSMETAWLLAAKLRLTHPAARIWVYIRWPSTFDIAAANLLAIEELIEHRGQPAELQMQTLDRLGVSVKMAAPGWDSPIGIKPVASVA